MASNQSNMTILPATLWNKFNIIAASIVTIDLEEDVPGTPAVDT